ncbi:hypothetical protein [Streptomyces niveus]|uniref:hypothetical protein n=1 Tax=Streptomyces niveus TaxID=193462 RepID=UPI0036D3C18C
MTAGAVALLAARPCAMPPATPARGAGPGRPTTAPFDRDSDFEAVYGDLIALGRPAEE